MFRFVHTALDSSANFSFGSVYGQLNESLVFENNFIRVLSFSWP